MSQSVNKPIEISLDSISKTSSLARAELSPHSQREKLSTSSGQGKRVGITTLGCKVNTYESELIAETLKTQEWSLVPNTEVADLYLINTCTVTREADRQARQEVRKVIKTNPEALVVVTGCYAQMDPEACSEIPGVDLVLGNDRKLDVHKLLPDLENGNLPPVLVGNLDQHVSLPDQLLAGYEAHTRAFVQIQQGCDQGCTFCIIHVARGPSRSLPPTLIKRQIERLVLNGYPEIVICGVDLGAYGDDFDVNQSNFDLVDLLEELLTIETDESNPFRIRLSSLDPFHISDRLIDLWSREDRLVNHLHLSLQSGNTLILKRMKRRYDADFVRSRVGKLKDKIPDLVISADVMVGFPTETQAQFQDTLTMVRDLEIAYPHTFSYSERAGTPAANIPASKQVPVSERKHRNSQVREAAGPILEKALASKIGKHVRVLPERKVDNKGSYICRSEEYLPCLVPSELVTKGRWLEVLVSDSDGKHLLAEG